MEKIGLEAINYFKKSCKELNKLYIPDPPREDAIADSLMEFYDKENLFKAIDIFVKSKTGPFLMFDFAVESRAYIDKVKFEKKALDNFKDIVEQTRKKMVSE